MFRAVENRKPLLVAANTGISAVIDPVGRITGHLTLGSEGVLDSGLPTAIALPLFTRIGDIPVAIIVALSALIAIRRRRAVKMRAPNF